jgi:hypothetical protein
VSSEMSPQPLTVEEHMKHHGPLPKVAAIKCGIWEQYKNGRTKNNLCVCVSKNREEMSCHCVALQGKQTCGGGGGGGHDTEEAKEAPGFGGWEVERYLNLRETGAQRLGGSGAGGRNRGSVTQAEAVQPNQARRWS